MMKMLTHKGVTAQQVDLKPVKWAGEEYHKEQRQKMAILSRNTILCTRRGTASLPLSEYKAVEKTRVRGILISTSRGTACRIL